MLLSGTKLIQAQHPLGKMLTQLLNFNKIRTNKDLKLWQTVHQAF